MQCSPWILVTPTLLHRKETGLKRSKREGRKEEGDGSDRCLQQVAWGREVRTVRQVISCMQI